jgi:hypothetical protein
MSTREDYSGQHSEDFAATGRVGTGAASPAMKKHRRQASMT